MVFLARGQYDFIRSQRGFKWPYHNSHIFITLTFIYFISFLHKQEQEGGKNYP